MTNRQRSRGFRILVASMVFFGLAGCTCPPCSAPVGDDKRIVLGMPRGLYPGYDREIHEVYVYRIPESR